MNLPDAAWLDALKLPLRVKIGVTLGAAALLILNHLEVIALNDFGSLAKPIVIVLGVFTGALSVSGVAALAFGEISRSRREAALERRRDRRKAEREEENQAAIEAALQRLDYLSASELRYLADCLRKNSQSFTGWVNSSSLSTLMAKRIILSPGGAHPGGDYPFFVLDYAWKELLRRKADFIALDEENAKDEARKRR